VVVTSFLMAVVNGHSEASNEQEGAALDMGHLWVLSRVKG